MTYAKLEELNLTPKEPATEDTGLYRLKNTLIYLQAFSLKRLTNLENIITPDLRGGHVDVFLFSLTAS